MEKYTPEQKAEALRLTEDLNTKPGEIDMLREYKSHMLYNSNTPDGQPAIENSYLDMNAAYGAWSIPGMVKATRRMIDRAGAEDFMLDVYSAEEIAESPDRAEAKLFWFPAGYETDASGAKKLLNADQPFVLAISGGAYTSLCNLSEAFPAAASLNELGYNVFALDYRVNLSDIANAPDPLFPKPLDDMAAALKYIFAHMEDFGLQNREYIVTGFSAGASLTVQWGVLSHGYAHYGLPKPKAMFPIYPVVDNRISYPEVYDMFNRSMFGPDYTEALLDDYAVQKVMTEEYPPCYIVHSENDATVPVRNSYVLDERMNELGIPHVLEVPKTAGHGFGDGSGTDAEGWPERAIRFAESL